MSLPPFKHTPFCFSLSALHIYTYIPHDIQIPFSMPSLYISIKQLACSQIISTYTKKSNIMQTSSHMKTFRHCFDDCVAYKADQTCFENNEFLVFQRHQQLGPIFMQSVRQTASCALQYTTCSSTFCPMMG